MKDLKNLGFAYLYTNLSIFICTFIITIFSIINLIGSKFVSLLELITIILCLFINSFILGKKTSNKGFLEGLKLGIIFSLTYLLISLFIFKTNVEIKNIIFYILLIIIPMFGSMIGINKRIDIK